MGLKEHKNNQLTKEQNDIKKYLLRIIQRYFDIENNFTQESIEAIIIESLTRLKHSIAAEKGFMFSFNQKTGNIVLTIKDFNGELAFNKNTAFNKDFGTENNTICEGNDIRLHNKREPLNHIHEIASIKELKEELEKFNIPSNLHIHENKKILNMIKYSGTQTQIDLIVIEYLQKSIDGYYSNLQLYQREANDSYVKCIEELRLYMSQLKDSLQNIKELIDSSFTWLQDSYAYTDTSITSCKTNIIKKLSSYISKQQVQNIIDFFSKVPCVITDGEIPLEDGEISFVPVQKNTETGAEIENPLRSIYDEGLRLGSDYWDWSEENQVLQIYLPESDGGYQQPLLVSSKKFDSYTHKVTLLTRELKNVSVIIAYDLSNMDNCLSFTINKEDNDTSENNVFGVLEFINNESRNKLSIINKQITEGNFNNFVGINVLIKKNRNNIKIWASYNSEDSSLWKPTIQNGIKDIYPIEQPLFSFNLNDYPEFAPLVDKEWEYGYKVYTPQNTTLDAGYSDAYFIDFTSIGQEPSYYTNISESKVTQYTLQESIINQVENIKTKLFFEYDKDGKTITSPLPFIFKNENGYNTIIQGAYSSTGDIIITSNFIHTIDAYIDNNNLYDNNTIITASYTNPDVYRNIKNKLIAEQCTLSLIDSTEKNEFVKSLLLPDKKYFIQGYNFDPDGSDFTDDNNNILSFTDWDSEQPMYIDILNVICINENKKWEIVNDIYNDKLGYVAEYKIKKLSQYFENPRIRYQVLGNKKVM